MKKDFLSKIEEVKNAGEIEEEEKKSLSDEEGSEQDQIMKESGNQEDENMSDISLDQIAYMLT